MQLILISLQTFVNTKLKSNPFKYKKIKKTTVNKRFNTVHYKCCLVYASYKKKLSTGVLQSSVYNVERLTHATK